MDRLAQAKKFTTQGMLAMGYAKVGVAGDAEGVEGPADMRQRRLVSLDYGDSLDIPPPDTDVTDEGIRATLLFDGVPFQTFVPWTAVLFVASDCGSVTFTSFLPAEDGEDADGEEDVALEAMGGAPAAPAARPRRERPAWLSLVD